jgi:hypothetical protein
MTQDSARLLNRIVDLIIGAILGAIAGVLLAPVLARIFSQQPNVIYSSGMVRTNWPQCTYFITSLRLPMNSLNSLFFEVHYPGKVTSTAILSGEDLGADGNSPMFDAAGTKFRLGPPCNIDNLGPSDPPPNLQIGLLSDQQSLMIQGSNVDAHSTVWIIASMYPYTPPPDPNNAPRGLRAATTGHAAYMAYGQELPAKITEDPSVKFNMQPTR